MDHAGIAIDRTDLEKYRKIHKRIEKHIQDTVYIYTELEAGIIKGMETVLEWFEEENIYGPR